MAGRDPQITNHRGFLAYIHGKYTQQIVLLKKDDALIKIPSSIPPWKLSKYLGLIAKNLESKQMSFTNLISQEGAYGYVPPGFYIFCRKVANGTPALLIDRSNPFLDESFILCDQTNQYCTHIYINVKKMKQ
jgi:hypothetical protein